MITHDLCDPASVDVTSCFGLEAIGFDAVIRAPCTPDSFPFPLPHSSVSIRGLPRRGAGGLRE